jgi:hypothetical protein
MPIRLTPTTRNTNETPTKIRCQRSAILLKLLGASRTWACLRMLGRGTPEQTSPRDYGLQPWALDDAYHETGAVQVVMTLDELYTQPPASITHDVGMLKGSWHNHLPELRALPAVDPKARIQIRHYKTACWELATVWFDNAPFMTIQNAGYERPVWKRFVTDSRIYVNAVAYLQTIEALHHVNDLADPYMELAT